MNTGGEVSEQMIRMSLEGVEVAAKITGTGAKHIAILLYSILSQKQKTRGKARLDTMLRSGKALDIFTVKNSDLKKFTEEAKRYGILYCVLTNRKSQDPNAVSDVMVRTEDAAKINRIVELFTLASVNTASIVTEAEKDKGEEATVADPEITTPDQADKEQLLNTLMGKPMQQEENAANPLVAKTEKSPPSAPSSEMPDKSAEGATRRGGKPSVKEELRKIKAGRKKPQTDKAANRDKRSPSSKAKRSPGQTRHKQPQRRKKTRKYRETR